MTVSRGQVGDGFYLLEMLETTSDGEPLRSMVVTCDQDFLQIFPSLQ